MLKFSTAQDLLKNFESKIDQSAALDANDDGIIDYIFLLKPDEPAKRVSQDLIMFLSDKSGYTQNLNLSNYWNGWGSGSADAQAPQLELIGVKDKRLLIVNITDSSDDATNQILKFTWEKNTFRLIGETKTATPRSSVTIDTGDELQGRWARSKEINWVTGDMIVKCDLDLMGMAKPKLKSGKISPKFITISDYDMSADYLDDICH